MLLTGEEVASTALIAYNREPVLFTLHLAQNFHHLLPSGFDEVRLVNKNLLDNIDKKKLAKDVSFDVLSLNKYDDITCGNLVWKRFENLEFRHSKSGAWYRFSMLSEEYDEYTDGHYLGSLLYFIAPGTEDYISISIKSILNSCRDQMNNEIISSVQLFPNIWTGKDLNMSEDFLKDFIRRCHNENASFDELTWRQMEELVAELLKIQGMDVTVTPASGDEGRDIIARGELIPGEPTIFTVEVKKKPVVGIHDVRAALYANRKMPALLIATSGRFSAGVIKEANISDNRYRLFLKDGIALKQWLSTCWERIAK